MWTPRGQYSRLWLLAPLLLNLLTQYPYQFDIGFQYSFGTIAFLFYLLVQNAADSPAPFRRDHLIFAAVTAVLMYTMMVVPQLTNFAKAYEENHETYERLEEILDTVPEDASVITSTWFLPHMANRTYIFEDEYHPEQATDFMVIDVRPGHDRNEYIATALQKGYTAHFHEENMVLILKAPDGVSRY